MRKIIKNSVIYSFSGTLIKLLSTINGIIVARYLGPSSFGVFSIAREYAGIFAPFSDFGVSLYIVKEGAQNKSSISKYLKEMINFKIIWSFLILIISGVIAKFLYNSFIFSITIIFIFSTIVYYFLAMFNSVFMAKNEIKEISISQVSYSSIILLIVILMVLLNRGLYFLVIGRALMTLLFSIVIYTIVKGNNKMSFSIKIIDFSKLKKIINKLLPYGISTILYFIYLKVIIIILSFMVDTQQVGIFSSAYQIIVGMYFLPGAILRVVLPTIASSFKNNRKDYISKFNKSVKYIAIIGAISASFLLLFSYYITKILYGDKYMISSNLLSLGAFAVFFESINIALGNGLTASGNQKYRAITYGVGTIFEILFSFIFVINFGVTGAIISLLCSEILLTFILFGFYNKLVNRLPIKELCKTPLIIIVTVYLLYVLFGRVLHVY
ncbi:MAG: oligosaccharide flippase family protein [Proteobacteria bacterium]|nr:oligosaccharide flippase family protein [Pseudomonadota bacterium]